MNLKLLICTLCALLKLSAVAQSFTIIGTVYSDQNKPLSEVQISGADAILYTDSLGQFRLTLTQKTTLSFFKEGHTLTTLTAYKTDTIRLVLNALHQQLADFTLTENAANQSLNTSPIHTLSYSPQYFQKNPSAQLFDALQQINGVKPQLNCNVCATGDIHINGMEGPYTAVLIDGMPMMSALATVYGFQGIPMEMIEKVEVTKGPGSVLYGPETMAGVINIITKNPNFSPRVSIHYLGQSDGLHTLDVGYRFQFKKWQVLTGIHGALNQQKSDINTDGFTDYPLFYRGSIFQKWQRARRQNRKFQTAIRYLTEQRWGGQLQWTDAFRGTDSVYGEVITTHRGELLNVYQLPVSPRMLLQSAATVHHQNSYYGTTWYKALQINGNTQLVWEQQLKMGIVKTGIAYRYQFYDDNTPATSDSTGILNVPEHRHLAGIFSEATLNLHSKHELLGGLRIDVDPIHGVIPTTRVGYVFRIHPNHQLRIQGGNGNRVVQLFTEDHAALTGARTVIISETLKPEISWSGMITYNATIPFKFGFLKTELQGFYTHFFNRILPDYEVNPNWIVYRNLQGYAVSRGLALETQLHFTNSLKIEHALTWMQVFRNENSVETPIFHAPSWSGTFSVQYTWAKPQLTIDWNGQWFGPMFLPTLPNDFRPPYSPWFVMTNVQFTYKPHRNWSIFAGVKNVFNFIPNHPLMRPFDPFDKYVDDPISNPMGYTFDPSYNYAPILGAHGFLGLRWSAPFKARDDR